MTQLLLPIKKRTYFQRGAISSPSQAILLFRWVMGRAVVKVGRNSLQQASILTELIYELSSVLFPTIGTRKVRPVYSEDHAKTSKVNSSLLCVSADSGRFHERWTSSYSQW